MLDGWRCACERGHDTMPEEMRQTIDRLETLVQRLEQSQTAGTTRNDPALLEEISDCVRALRGQNDWTQSLVDHAFDAFVAVNEAGNIVRWNRRAERIFGHARADAMGAPLVDLAVAEPDREYGAEEIVAAVSGNADTKRRLDLTGLRADGAMFPVEMLLLPPVDMGHTRRMGLFVRDVTAEHRSVQALHESESLYMSLVDNLPIHVARKNLDGQITYANRSFCELLGLDEDEILGKTDHQLFPDEVADKYRGDDLWVIETGKVFVDVEENPAGGQTRYYEVRKTPVRGKAHKIVGVQLIFWDVTQRTEAQRALREAKEAAEAASRAKSEFVANVSHEIRTPMNAIIGMTEMLLNMEVTESQRDYLSMVRDAGETLLALVNDVLDFSKIEAGRLELNSEPFDLAESLGTTMKTLAMRAHGKDIEFVFRVAPDVPPVVVGDALRLRQIIVNLVGNAIKFTEEGEIALFVEGDNRTDKKEDRDDPAADQVVLSFRVVDTGIGIPDDVRSQIFGAFEQADSSTTRRYGGTGLGLAIASQLVRAMDGQINVESKVGQGSTFRFTATFGMAPSQPKRDKQVLARLAGKRTLVVDDNTTNRQTVSELLAQYGMHVAQSASGAGAVEQCANASARGEPFDLVIADIGMPNITASELVAGMRASRQPSPKIIVMTTGVSEGDLELFQKMDVTARLLKPVKRSELFDAVARTILGIQLATEQARVEAPGDDGSALRSLHILVAEDSPVNQKLASGLLQRDNHRVTIANNGREAVLATKNQSFDLVLMDVQMPEMDGIEATALIREMEQSTGTHLPIIAMTAHAMPGDRERCLQAGMDGYVSKPIRVKELYREIGLFVTGSPKRT